MKDVRERYAASEEMAEDNLTGTENRSAKEFPKDNMTNAIYEFLYGDENGSDSLMWILSPSTEHWWQPFEIKFYGMLLNTNKIVKT